MASWIDTLGATLLFGVVVLIVVGLNAMLMSTSHQDNFRTIVNEQISGVDTLAGLTAIFAEDIQNAGYNSTAAFRLADSNKITILGDIDQTGSADSVRWYLSAVTPPAGTNPNLRNSLLRKQNTQSGLGGGLGVSLFRLFYYDSLGRAISTPVASGSLGKIRSIKVQIQVESSYRVAYGTDTSYAASYWERTFTPRNLRAVR